MAPRKRNKYLEAYESAVQNGVRAGRKALKEIQIAPPLKSVWAEAKTRGQRAAGVARRQARSAEAELAKRQAQLAKRLEGARREAGTWLEKLRTDFVSAAGIASKSQIDELKRRIAILSKRLDSLIGRKPTPKALKAG
jgi:hypothetical protein